MDINLVILIIVNIIFLLITSFTFILAIIIWGTDDIILFVKINIGAYIGLWILTGIVFGLVSLGEFLINL